MQEVAADVELHTAIHRVLQVPKLNFVDETDAFFHPLVQLIYACGRQVPLPNFAERVEVILRLLLELERDTKAQSILHKAGVAEFQQQPGHWGCRQDVRILQGAFRRRCF